MKNQTVIYVVLGTVVILSLLYFGFFANRASQSPTEKVNLPTVTTTQQKIETFNLEGKPFEFNVKEIRVKKGDRVKINMTTVEGFHDFTLTEFNVKTKQLPVGQSDSVEFTADKTGTFEYYCSVGNHRQMGMVGKFIVE